jgi:hypothetical protein
MKRIIVILSVFCLLFAAWGASAQVFRFDPLMFHFITKIPDDGRGEGGGYQEARAVLRIVDSTGSIILPRIYNCPVVVGMGIRTKTEGVVTPERAAEVTAGVATYVTNRTYHKQKEWVTAQLCNEILAGMQLVFAEHHGGLGARVHKPR